MIWHKFLTLLCIFAVVSFVSCSKSEDELAPEDQTEQQEPEPDPDDGDEPDGDEPDGQDPDGGQDPGDGDEPEPEPEPEPDPAPAYITADKSEISFYESGESATITVESNYGWDYSYDEANGWFSVERSGDILTVTTIADNSGANRSAHITLTACEEDNVDNSAEFTVTVVQYSALPDALILTYTTTSRYKTVTLPITGQVDCTVNWGDGTSDQVTSGFPTHTYSSEDSYSVVIDGTVTALSSYNLSQSSATPLLTGVEQWGNTGLTSMEYAFYFCTNLTSLPEMTGTPFTSVTTFNSAFWKCAFEHIPNDLLSSAVNATSLYSTFRNCESLKEIPADLLKNCGNVTDLERTFYGNKSITEIPAHLFDGCPNAETFKDCFQQGESIETVPADLFAYNTKVTSMYAVFYGCSALTEIPSTLFDNCMLVTDFGGVFGDTGLVEVPEDLFKNCNEVTTFYKLFWGCESLKSVPAGIFAGKSKVTDFSYSFDGCTSLETIPEGLFKGCTWVTDFSHVFDGCSSLQKLPSGLFADSPRVTTFYYAFADCPCLTSLPDDLFAANPAVESFDSAFRNCSALTSLPENLFASNTQVQTFKNTFYQCTNLTGESAYDVREIDGEQVMIHLYERKDHTDLYYASSNSGTYSYQCYNGCTGLSDYSSIPGGWR